MHAELWGIVKGLQIAVPNDLQNIIVDSDSLMALQAIKTGCPSSHPCAALVQDILILSRRVQNIDWNHTLREANAVADIMAKKGHDLPIGLHIFDAPTPDIILALNFDMYGSFRLRGL
ncbi:uncharacterized protein LOC107463901 [Arachis duranensis]|uniref:Uncharacterized protein LOC107463901 n=1 Tax=Arachis duranensis TaxID=130453 RepID=A0A6P4BED5_ARADU|nr:uncharacterized protein LOC107463901 [Arachis duranensis]